MSSKMYVVVGPALAVLFCLAATPADAQFRVGASFGGYGVSASDGVNSTGFSAGYGRSDHYGVGYGNYGGGTGRGFGNRFNDGLGYGTGYGRRDYAPANGFGRRGGGYGAFYDRGYGANYGQPYFETGIGAGDNYYGY